MCTSSTLLTIVVCLLVTLNIIVYFYMKRRFKNLLMSNKEEFEEEKRELLQETLRPLQETEKEKIRIAEANLNLLEHQEKLQEQKIRLAEANLKLLELKEQVEHEKERSERLLHNILPARVAKELRETGHSVPECFDNVTVFFSDIVDFTQITSTIDPQDVIKELSDIFTEFDRIFNRNRCERIKTIGDAYLSVSGMPEPDSNHYKNILSASLEALDYLRSRNDRANMRWNMRMGVHTGKVVGGIVGIEKYIYDVFGDTINTAARMEKHSEPMRVNVSETTYNLARNFFNFTARDHIEVKGKGTVKMYFLENKK